MSPSSVETAPKMTSSLSTGGLKRTTRSLNIPSLLAASAPAPVAYPKTSLAAFAISSSPASSTRTITPASAFKLPSKQSNLHLETARVLDDASYFLSQPVASTSTSTSTAMTPESSTTSTTTTSACTSDIDSETEAESETESAITSCASSPLISASPSKCASPSKERRERIRPIIFYLPTSESAVETEVEVASSEEDDESDSDSVCEVAQRKTRLSYRTIAQRRAGSLFTSGSDESDDEKSDSEVRAVRRPAMRSSRSRISSAQAVESVAVSEAEGPLAKSLLFVEEPSPVASAPTPAPIPAPTQPQASTSTYSLDFLTSLANALTAALKSPSPKVIELEECEMEMYPSCASSPASSSSSSSSPAIASKPTAASFTHLPTQLLPRPLSRLRTGARRISSKASRRGRSGAPNSPTANVFGKAVGAGDSFFFDSDEDECESDEESELDASDDEDEIAWDREDPLFCKPTQEEQEEEGEAVYKHAPDPLFLRAFAVENHTARRRRILPPSFSGCSQSSSTTSSSSSSSIPFPSSNGEEEEEESLLAYDPFACSYEENGIQWRSEGKRFRWVLCEPTGVQRRSLRVGATRVNVGSSLRSVAFAA